MDTDDLLEIRKPVSSSTDDLTKLVGENLASHRLKSLHDVIELLHLTLLLEVILREDRIGK